MSHSSRRWPIRLLLIAAILLISFLFVRAYWNTGQLPPDIAQVFIRHLSNRHASDREVAASLGDTEKLRGEHLGSNFAGADYVRKWKFHQEAFDKYSDLEATGFFDDQGNCITFVCSSINLEGKRLWLFRWQRLLNSMGL